MRIFLIGKQREFEFSRVKDKSEFRNIISGYNSTKKYMGYLEISEKAFTLLR